MNPGMNVTATIIQTFSTCFQHYIHGNASYQICPRCSPTVLHHTVRGLCLNTSVSAVRMWLEGNIPDVSRIQNLHLALPLYGYITPVIFVLTLFLNCLMVIVFLWQTRTSSTNVLLISIAVCDALSITFPTPWYLYYFSWKHYTDFVPYSWCVYYSYLSTVAPTVCHNCSVWLTVLLAVHRYAGVRQPKRHSCFTSFKCVIVWIIVIVAVTLLLHLTYLCLNTVRHVRVLSKHVVSDDGFLFVDTCQSVPRISRTHYTTYLKAYIWVRTIFVQILPLVLLTIFNVLLLKTVCGSYRYRKGVNSGSRYQKPDQKEVIRTSAMLITICVFTWVVEIPQCVMLLCVYLQTLQGVQMFSVEGMKNGLTVINFILFLTLPSNFLICFGLSDRFREALKNLIRKRKPTRRSGICTTAVSTSLISNGHSEPRSNLPFELEKLRPTGTSE